MTWIGVLIGAFGLFLLALAIVRHAPGIPATQHVARRPAAQFGIADKQPFRSAAQHVARHSATQHIARRVFADAVVQQRPGQVRTDPLQRRPQQPTGAQQRFIERGPKQPPGAEQRLLRPRPLLATQQVDRQQATGLLSPIPP